MEFLIIIMILLIIIIILGQLFWSNKNKIDSIVNNKELDLEAQKYPNNLDMCKEYLKILNNENVIVEEDKKSKNSLYIAMSNKIIIANVGKSFTRIQTIAHECLHSIQNRKILMFNFIYSNIFIIFFILISILALLKVLPYKMMFLAILIFGGFIYYFVRSYLEDDAMIKARFLVKEYMEDKRISSREKINEILQCFDKLNDVGIRAVNYTLLINVIIKIFIFCIICIFR